jgi:hypothetical protein
MATEAREGASDYARRFAEAMRLCGIDKQTEIAARIGVTKATINALLGGRSRYLDAPNSAIAARVMQVDHDWLATGEGEPRPLLMLERMGLSPKAVEIGRLFDQLEGIRRDRAYALIVQMIGFDSDDPR